ncbi:MAG: hypothetical protein methR_P1172 [Methyloprofundus sp.]|nr:MAG: hypothetical protein methR_P1172 [Methyloprofundus sp.]
MNITLKKYLVVSFLVLSLGTTNHVTAATETEIELTQVTNTVITNLEEALKAVTANKLDKALDYIYVTQDSAIDILGACSISAKKERGSTALKKARRQINKGDTAGAAVSLKKAIKIFKSLLLPVDNGRPSIVEWFK